MTLNYAIEKFRHGIEGEFTPWKFSARYDPLKADDIPVDDEYQTTENHSSLDLLAKELATFPDIGEARLSQPGYPNGCTYSIRSGGPITQIGRVTDDELGELTLAVHMYLRLDTS